MNRFKLSLSGLLDTARKVLGLPAAEPDAIRLCFEPLVGSWNMPLVQTIQNTVESQSGTQTSGFSFHTGGVWTIAHADGELHGFGGMIAAEPEVRWIGVPTAGDRQRVALMQAMPSPDMTIRTDLDGAFLGASSAGFSESVIEAMRTAAPPGTAAHVNAHISAFLDADRIRSIAHQNWFVTTGFFLGEPELVPGRTYSLAGTQPAVDGGQLSFTLQFGLRLIEGSSDVEVWLEERLDIDDLGRITRFQMAKAPPGSPVPVPVEQVERNNLRLDPTTLHVHARTRARVTVSDVAGVGRITRIDRLERSSLPM